MESFTVSSAELFDKRNNPAGRLDAGFAKNMAVALNDLIDDSSALESLKSLKKDFRGWYNWESALRKMTKIEDVEDHIACALGARARPTVDASQSDLGIQASGDKQPPRRPYDHFSPKMQTGISSLAKRACQEESVLIKQQLESELTAALRLAEMGAAELGGRGKTTQPKSDVQRDKLA